MLMGRAILLMKYNMLLMWVKSRERCWFDSPVQKLYM